MLITHYGNVLLCFDSTSSWVLPVADHNYIEQDTVHMTTSKLLQLKSDSDRKNVKVTKSV